MNPCRSDSGNILHTFLSQWADIQSEDYHGWKLKIYQILNFQNSSLKTCSMQLNLDYSKCQRLQESFRIIDSSNDRKREFSDFFRKARMLSWNITVLPEFATSTRVFHPVIGTSVKALKKMSSLEVVASSSLILCRSKNAEKKRKSDLYWHPLYTCNNID